MHRVEFTLGKDSQVYLGPIVPYRVTSKINNFHARLRVKCPIIAMICPAEINLRKKKKRKQTLVFGDKRTIVRFLDEDGRAIVDLEKFHSFVLPRSTIYHRDD